MTLEAARLFLGLDETADAKTVKRAFRQMARLLHPDQHQIDSELYVQSTRLMRNLNDAHEIVIKNRGTKSHPYERTGSRQPQSPRPNSRPVKNHHPKGLSRLWSLVRLASHYASWLALILLNGQLAGVVCFLLFQVLASLAKRMIQEPTGGRL